MYKTQLLNVFLLFSTVFVLGTEAAISTGYYAGNETDFLALLSFRSMITHDPFGVLSSWNTSFHFCEWEGVVCGERHRRVTVINLNSQGLVGSLSPHVGNLSFLREIRVSNNSFNGEIPHELGRLVRLQVLDLSRNKFNGAIPANLSHCSNLLQLGLTANKLVGKIPLEVSLLSKLKLFFVSMNSLTGGIPPFVGNLTSLESFFVSVNPLGGSIPDSLGRLKNLRKIGLGACKLTGTIPPSLYNLSLLTNFSVAENQLIGSLPPSLGAMLPNIQFLQLRTNQLTGSLPGSLSNCSNLDYLELADNKFSGPLKVDFARLTNLRILWLSRNHFAEMIPFDSMANCSKLQELDLAYNKITGILPYSIGNLSNQLSWLGLGSNQLYGSLPSSIGNLVGVTSLIVDGNKLTGFIPPTIGRLENVQQLALSDNQFSGSIPDSIGNLTSVNLLYLYTNRLEGRIPSSLGNCKDLTELDLSHNKLTGNIPKNILQLSSLTTLLNLSQNNLSGSLPSEVAQLKNLNALDLSDAGLSGTIPGDLSGCISLESLYLQGNLFQGMIPPSLSSLKGIVNLDMSHNNLSGYIPQFLEGFSLQYLNLSFNDFEGEVPVKGVFANVSAFSVFGNSRLCGGLQELGLQKCKETKKPQTRSHVLIIVISIVCILLFVCVLPISVFSWHKKKKKSQQSELMKERFLKVSYGELLNATNGFAEANLIGVGGFSSVYKGIFDDNIVVAVKVLHLQNRAAYKSFIAECEAWRNTRHRNLLKIITSCSSIDFQGNDFKALVYEFMPNGSLESWLHSSPTVSRLNLLQRISILIDVATALDYLHNRCHTPIAHCDLKPSNILLDDNMMAHVGDFGLAKFLQTEASHNSSIGFRGTIGYVAPEYGLASEMSTSGDVYSFGILLLEMVTGKRPTDNMFNEGLNLHKLACMALPDCVTDIVDQILLNFEEAAPGPNDVQYSVQNANKIKECLVSAVKIGVACSLESPQDRMNIEQVVRELQYIRGVIQSVST